MDSRLLSAIHDELNASCFEGVLPRCTFEFGLCRDPAIKDAEYEALYYANYSGSGTIFLNPAYNGTVAEVRACIAHEMIHQWQDLCGLRLDHRAVFHAWGAHILSITGIVV